MELPGTNVIESTQFPKFSPPMNDFVLRPAWWIVVCGLMSTLSLTFVLPILGQHTADYSPFHQHVITGADTPDERRQALADHQHGGAQSPHHPDESASGPSARSVPNPVPASAGNVGLDGSRLCLACAGAHLLAALDQPGPTTPPAIWQRVTTSPLSGAWHSAPPPPPPPR